MLRNAFGKKKWQNFFLILHNLSIKGFNLHDHNMKSNGELNVIKNLFSYFKKKVYKKPLVIFDVGANSGNYCKEVINASGGINFHLYAFEPLKAAYELLNSELRKTNNSNYKAYNIGFGDFEGETNFFADHESSEAGSFYNRDFSVINLDIKPMGKVLIEKLDNFCERNGIEYINYVKIDVEGAEIEVLKGARSTLINQRIGFLQFEYGTGNIESKTYLKSFFEIIGENYVLFRILKDGLLLIEKYHIDYEILRLGNYFAISKNIYATEKDILKRTFNF